MLILRTLLFGPAQGHEIAKHIQRSTDEVLQVVEGFSDAMHLHQSGFQNVCALMGSSLSETQAQKLAIHFDRGSLTLGDHPGREATRKIAGQLEGRVGVKVTVLPDGMQPDQLDATAIRALLEPEHQRPGNRQDLSAADSPRLRRGPDEAKLEV